MGHVIIRPVKQEDIPAIIEIYRPYVEQTGVSFEYTTPTLAEFTERVAKYAPVYPFLVAESVGEIIGYAYGSRYAQRDGYNWCAEVSVYTSPLAKSRGIGEKLYRPLMHLMKNQNIYRLVALISNPNPKSLYFHSRMGFTRCGVFPNCGFKNGEWHDIFHLEKELISVKEYPTPPSFIPFIELDESFVQAVLARYNNQNQLE